MNAYSLSLSILFTVLSVCAGKQKNVLFIPVDDMKPMLGCYGNEAIKTPNFDRLASMGTTFLNAHCQQAVCGPSRASLLTGWRPDRTKVWDLKTRIRDINPDVVTLPQYFKENGYISVGIGKTFDPRSVDGRVKNDPASWSVPYLLPAEKPKTMMGFREACFVAEVVALRRKYEGAASWYENVKKELNGTPAVEGTEDVPDSAYDDGGFAELAVEQIHQLSKQESPFFLAVGFKKPHLPFVAPKKYWDLYERDSIDLASFQAMPDGAPDYHFQDSWELKNGSYRGYKGVKVISEAQQRELIHGYMACISYIDAQIGKLLNALDSSGVAEDTIVVVWGDHGFHLGDHGMFCKHTNYEQATRVPLIITPAAVALEKPHTASAPVESIDVYPTLLDLAGLPIPDSLDGVSLKPILERKVRSVKPYAVSQYNRRCSETGASLMGYAFRNKSLRYIEWVDQNDVRAEPQHRELYDYTVDPLEKKNLLNDKAYAEQLSKVMSFSQFFRNKMHRVLKESPPF